MKYLLLCLLFIAGCEPQKTAIDPTTLPDEIKSEIFKWKIKTEIIHKTDWLATMFIVGGAASVFMLVRGMATGFPLLCAAVGGLIALRIDQSLAEKTWPYWAMGLFLLAGFVYYFYVTFIHKRAFKEVVAGGELFKAGFPFADAQSKAQSKTTRKLVKKAKEK